QPFMPKFVRNHLSDRIRVLADRLIDGFAPEGRVELRRAFAARLPIQVMLSLFGFPPEDEATLRRWYDSFEAALANFSWDPEIRRRAHADVAAFHDHLQERMDYFRAEPDEQALLSALVNGSPESR